MRVVEKKIKNIDPRDHVSLLGDKEQAQVIRLIVDALEKSGDLNYDNLERACASRVQNLEDLIGRIW